MIFGVDGSSLVHTDNNKQFILVLGTGITQGLDDATIAAAVKFHIAVLLRLSTALE